MRIPTFSRQSDTTTETDRAAVPASSGSRSSSGGSAAHSGPLAPGRDGRDERDETTANLAPLPPAPARNTAPPAPPAPPAPRRDTAPIRPRDADISDTRHDLDTQPGARPTPQTPAGPKPRASLLATLGLISGVAGALLVLSGPLLGYGIGVAGLALVLSLLGLRATRKRHIAGKTDALIGLLLALGAIVVGVLALTGSLSWAGTDVQPVNNLREWLDAQFGNRF
ncbi:hypothetical protein [Actinoplanes sp. TFC3]|uniref:hypothetical protein n=1 Tax=Actinoplanes sp. TFC3 TaxID=1710355 RepID=UPI000836D98C|nr:hypothetical protein [Actinoplanes sp. TFC3]